MKIIADTHTHTIASTHAYATATEMISEAAKVGLYAIALTDHGPKMPGSPGPWYFDNLSAIPDNYMGVRVLKGAEANLCDFDGNIDMPEGTIKRLDWIVASIHDITLDKSKKNVSVDTITELYMNAAKNPFIHVIGHPDTVGFRFDYEKALPELARCGKLIEINDSTFRYKKNSMANCIEIANICKRKNIQVILNTDAHFTVAVGKFDETLCALQEIDFPEELIVNSSVERFENCLLERGISLV
ncbi:MAG: phosphatase [Clostridia bacterium]|nr:phosphatase [Clostridia bacterium]